MADEILIIYNRRGQRTTVKFRSLLAATKALDAILLTRPMDHVKRAPVLLELRRSLDSGLHSRFWWCETDQVWVQKTDVTPTEAILTGLGWR